MRIFASRKNAFIEETLRIYLCYVTRGTRATRLEDRGWVTIDDLWAIARSVSGGLMAGLHDRCRDWRIGRGI